MVRFGFLGNPKYLDPFISLLESKGHTFTVLDLKRPIEEQGVFDVLMHKIVSGPLGKTLLDNLKSYQRVRPGCLVVDDPTCVCLLTDRQKIAEKLSTLCVRDSEHVVSQPSSVVLSQESDLEKVQLPVVAKPFLGDGSALSHELALVYNKRGLRDFWQAHPDTLYQEFVNHSAVLHKIYAIGDTVFVGQRPSLPNVTPKDLEEKSFEFFGRISRNEGEGSAPSLPNAPSLKAIEKTCQELRARLGINFFGVDMISKENSCEHFVIDVNYFPSYTGMKNAHQLMYDFIIEQYSTLNEKKKFSGA